MQRVKVAKTELVSAVTANRAGHRKIFEEALEGYRRKQIEELEEQLTRLRAGKRLSRLYFLPVPEDHTKDYDRVLKMLAMHTDDVIEVSQEDFAKYVLDDWDWRRAFLSSNSSYSGTAAAMVEEATEE